jgi:hypothetical protein
MIAALDVAKRARALVLLIDRDNLVSWIWILFAKKLTLQQAGKRQDTIY